MSFLIYIITFPFLGLGELRIFQNPDTSEKHFYQIETLMEKGGHILAVEELEKIKSKFPQSYRANKLLGKSLMALQQYEKAIPVYELLYAVKVKKPDPYVLFQLAFAQYRSGDYKSALENLTKFEAGRPPFNASIWADMKNIRTNISQINSLPTGKERYVMDTNFVFPNSSYADFSPIPLGDSAFIFSTLRHDNLVEKIPGEVNFNTIKLLHYKIRPDGRFDEISVIKNINKAGYHNGNGSISKDGKRFFFTRCSDGEKGKLNCAIYEAEIKKDGSFHNIHRLNEKINKRKYSASQPYFKTVKVNGNELDVLFFTSNRRGGFGKNDIWYSTYNRKKKRFSAPFNCGFQVNSTGNDESPFLDESGQKFYFSSDGFPGMGGKDIFSAKANGIMLSGRELLSSPINSSGDESYFYLLPDGSSGFIASNRKGANLLDQKYCCEDIFRFTNPEYKPNPKTEKADTIKKEVEKAIVSQPLPVKTDTTAAAKPTNIQIDELIGLNVSDPKIPNQLNSKSNIRESQTDKVIRKVYFAKNSDILTTKAKGLLNGIIAEIKIKKPKEVSISGFADIKGSLAYNQSLALKRAKAVKSYCAKQKLKTMFKTSAKDLGLALQTEDNDMLSLDRFVEISWKK